jgi:hypothetical protein
MAKTGRRTKYTPERIAKIADGLRLGMTHKLAAQYAGISVSCLHKWLRRGRGGEAEFEPLIDAVLSAEAEDAANALACINSASADDWRAAAWKLAHRHGYTKDGRANSKMPEAEDKSRSAESPATRADRIRRLRGMAEDACLEAGRDHSWQAFFRGLSTVEQLDVALHVETLGREDDLEDNTSDQFAQALAEEARHWPKALMEVVIREYEAQTGQKLLGVIEGGRA